ncbi:hypothetical protein [Desulfogranum japonicum]|uniref:hypothetical protein n=1 Tax=Desulfogranum japonicum TaxID=231447 RepID=UPI000426B865|nr:hypothetical protein [Desulfogranum japonicum]
MKKTKRQKELEAKIGVFDRQYGRKAQKNTEPNDRKYDRNFERVVKRLSPEELSNLLYGDEEE